MQQSDDDLDTDTATESDGSTCSSNNEGEIWDGVLPEALYKDLGNPPPLPEAQPNQRTIQRVNSLVFWFVYFLLIWQVTCHISDNGITWLLRFIVSWLEILGFEAPNPVLSEVIRTFPRSLHLLRHFLDIDRDTFNKFVVCPKCTKLYDYDSCLTVVNNQQCAKTCSNTFYSRGKRNTCGATLLTKVMLKHGKECFYPIKYYCCNSISNDLEKLVQREGFGELCEKWRQRKLAENEMADVYDGNLWQSYQTVKGKHLLKSPRNYGMMLNFDFFQPMKHRKDYSVGVFYLVILNLPRVERFKWENVIIVGIVPSLDREPKDLNEFLEPAIRELKGLWIGVKLKSALSRLPLTFRAAVMCTSSDIPATRKLCGFKGHSSLLGCSRCFKNFPGEFGKKRDYSGFQRNLWKPRTNKEHRQQAAKLKAFKTITQRLSFGRKNGITHSSILLELEYFDIIRSHTIDPMHNLFLGTAKKMFTLWNENSIFTSRQLEEIERRIESMDVPSDIGRLPKKIASNAGSYTAEQWKNWTLIYSLFCLKGILPDQHFKCWQTFVLGCRYICLPFLSMTDLEIADRLLLKFCQEVENLYGKEVITPNMHLHCHLKEVILDHGPVTSFWCFSFERFNGILGSTPTNKRSVEIQIMRRFVISRSFDGSSLPPHFREEFLGLCSISSNEDFENLASSADWSKRYAFHKISSSSPLSTDIDWRNHSGIVLPSYHRLSYFDTDDMLLLLNVYRTMYHGEDITIDSLSETMHKYGSITIDSVCYGSKMEPRRIRSGYILASWPAGNGHVNKETFALSGGQVKYYFSHSLKIGEEYCTNYFANVQWYRPDEEDSCYYGNPVKVWKQEFQAAGPSSFMPVQIIYSRFASAKLKKENGTFKLVSSPLSPKIFL